VHVRSLFELISCFEPLPISYLYVLVVKTVRFRVTRAISRRESFETVARRSHKYDILSIDADPTDRIYQR